MTPLLHKYGTWIGGILMAIEQFLFRGRYPFTLTHKTPDYACMKKASEWKKLIIQNPMEKLALINYLLFFFQIPIMKKINLVT